MPRLLNQRILLARLIARIKREIIQRVANEVSEIESIAFGPIKSETLFNAKKVYSNLTTIEIQHERDLLPQGHLFQERRLYGVQDVVIDLNSGILFTNHGKIIEESSSWPSMNLLLNSIPKPPTVGQLPNIREPQVICISSNGFYHWLIEDLAPFIFAQREFPNATILLSESAPLYVKAFAQKYYPNITIAPRFVHLEHYFFVSKGPDTEWVHPQDVLILRKFFASSMKEIITGRKIYISRVNSSRSPIFELALISYLTDSGWTILETQGLSLDEQIEAISSAEVVCGVHGAGLAGMVWMATGTTVIELGPRNFVPCFSRLSEICNLQYFRIPYEDDELMTENQVFLEIEAISARNRFPR